MHYWNGFKVKEPRRKLVRNVNEYVVDNVLVPTNEDVIEEQEFVNEVVTNDIDDSVDFNFSVDCSTQIEELDNENMEQIKAENIQLRAKVAALEK